MLPKKIAVCKIKWKQLKRDKISEKIKFLFLNKLFYMMELKSDPPTKVFELLLSPTVQLDLMFPKKIAVRKIKWKQLKRDQIREKIKFFVFKSNFLYDGAEK